MPLDPGVFAAFVGVVALICITPGPDMLFVVATGIRHGGRSGVAAAAGIQGGMVVHTAAAVVGLSRVIASSAAAFEALRLCGAAYLLWLAVNGLRSGGSASAGDERAPASPTTGAIVRRAAITNLLNPKIVVFFLAFLPQFVDRSRGDIGLQLLLLSATFMVVGLAIDAGIGVLAGRARTRLVASRSASRRLQRVAAAVYGALAVRLLTERA